MLGWRKAIVLLGLALFGGFYATVYAYAESCDTNCHDQCRVDLGFTDFIEPSCHLKCEAAKKTACAIGTPIPTINMTPYEQAKQLLEQSCTAAFEAFTKPLIAGCSNWDGRLDDQDIIDFALRVISIQQPQLIVPGVQIRWCPHLNPATRGIAADPNRIYLNIALKNSPRDIVVATVAHELVHALQYRRMGTDNFKCSYSRSLVACSGCQDRGHPIEREAYEYEDWFKANMRRGSLCVEPGNSCMGTTMYPVGWGCQCRPGPYLGVIQ